MQDTLRKNIMIVGGGGHAKVLISAILSTGEYTINGIVDQKLKPDCIVSGVPVIGNDELLLQDEMRKSCLAIGVGLMELDGRRRMLYEHFSEMGYMFPVIIHSSAIVASDVVVKDGTQIMAGVIIQPCVSIGTNCIINTGAVIEHDCIVEDHCHISPGVTLGGGVSVGEESLIGLGASVLPGVQIGKKVVIGAGSVVTKNVGNNCVVRGVPAR